MDSDRFTCFTCWFRIGFFYFILWGCVWATRSLHDEVPGIWFTSQLTDHVMAHHLDETFQSAYKNFHSTETALVRVQNDILCAIDNNESVILLLLDLSAAFDTVDHSILLSRLRDRFGVNGTAAAWFESYLTSRTQFVRVNDCRSTQRSLERGVPQGSVLGPLLYLL